MEDVKFKANPHEIARILNGYPLRKVELILAFVCSLLTRVRSGHLEDYDWCSIADYLGILDEVVEVIEAFNIPEEEFWRRYRRPR